MFSTFPILFGGLNAWINHWHNDLFYMVSYFSFCFPSASSYSFARILFLVFLSSSLSIAVPPFITLILWLLCSSRNLLAEMQESSRSQDLGRGWILCLNLRHLEGHRTFQLQASLPLFYSPPSFIDSELFPRVWGSGTPTENIAQCWIFFGEWVAANSLFSGSSGAGFARGVGWWVTFMLEAHPGRNFIAWLLLKIEVKED